MASDEYMRSFLFDRQCLPKPAFTLLFQQKQARCKQKMCKIYNSVGSLTVVKSHLRDRNVNDFKSLNEIINFQNNYTVTRQQIISNHSLLIEQEKTSLSEEIAQLRQSIETRKSEVEQQLHVELDKLQHQLDTLSSTHSNIFRTFIAYLKKRALKIKIQQSKVKLESRVRHSVQHLTDILVQKSNRHQYIDSNFEEAVNQSSWPQLLELEKTKRIIDEVNTSIYGALGEQKVVRELENLSNEYILINDFNCSFQPPIYNRQENDYIKSIQIDHLLISPNGIFLIETKNWSEHSLNNPSLRSPVQQIKRTNFALFKMLTGAMANSTLNLNQHHWGARKIPLRNLIVLINQKPDEEFQYVKVLTLKELLRYVKYFKPTFSNSETEEIANYLLKLNGHH